MSLTIFVFEYVYACAVLCLCYGVCMYAIMLHVCFAVFAPTLSPYRYGIFQLTVPEGLDLIQRCPSSGFHTHPDTHNKRPIYDGCTHVRIDQAAIVDVLDLRLS